MKKLYKLLLLPLFTLSLTGCDLFSSDTDVIHNKSYEPVTGKYYLYEAEDKRVSYHDTYFDIDGKNFTLKYYENGELKRDGKIQKLLTRKDYIGKWSDVLHFNVKIGSKAEHISTYTESIDPINQFRIIEEYYNPGDAKFYLSELPYVLGTYVREEEEYKEEAKHTNTKDLITPTLENFTSAINGTYKLDDDHYFYFLCPRGWATPDGFFLDCYFQYYSSSLDKPIEGFVSGRTFEGESTLVLKTLRDSVDWGKGSEGRINFGYSTFDEEDRMIDHDGTINFSDGVLHSFTFEHLSRRWTDDEWNKFISDESYHLPDAILYDYIGGTYVKI